ncbi:MAG: heme biosynthesis protein HemY [Rhodospirillales bacterium]|jgi:HemY protein|nr:heme biosynthesis protein HemY [Rhodospirillales bacterium]MBT4005884.1 heme biosynthesis protein HemY [Rhodospirillales bacterium]MBT5077071.1 heme biosynthesis protein HemY [Rhodospirillales bacterium]MBT5112595.1 heme biosynthesis protein HemY [Rhodospirillales bacterium]MBT5672119.1 heme biosynthesis protein HemY [Rhodospirillales bacterium]
MSRVIWFLILAVLVIPAVGWFAGDPGRMVLEFRGWQIETSVGLMAGAMIAVVISAILIYSVVSTILSAPQRLKKWRLEKRREKGLRYLSRGMVAVAAGDALSAHRAAQRAERLLDAVPLTLLLSAQAAQLEGDEKAAEKYFNAMLDRPDMEFLGLRGLLIQAGRCGDNARALAYAERAAEIKPDAPWVQTALFELAVKAGLWGEAEDALKQAVRRGGIDRVTGAQHRGAILLQQSHEAEDRKFIVEARELAKRARRAAPSFVPAVLRLATLDIDRGNKRSAKRILERAFKTQPHPDIASTYGKLAEGDGDDLLRARLRLMERLLKLNPDHPESHFGVANAAHNAGLWDEARAHAAAAEKHFLNSGTPPARLYRLLASIEEDEKGDRDAAGRWLMRAGDAALDHRWICSSCGAGFVAWTAPCPQCQSFDCLHWDTPESVSVISDISGTDGAHIGVDDNSIKLTKPSFKGGDED